MMQFRKAKMREKIGKNTGSANTSTSSTGASVKSQNNSEGDNKIKLGGSTGEEEPGFLDKLKSGNCCQ